MALPKHNTIPDFVLAHERGGRLYIGSLPASENTSELERRGITSLVTCLHSVADHPTSLPRYHIPVRDNNAESITPLLEEACEFIESKLCAGEGVLVHCSSGVSRSATVVLAYLVLRRGLHLRDAYRLLHSKRHCIQPGTLFFSELQKLRRGGESSEEESAMGLDEYYAYAVVELIKAMGYTRMHDENDLLLRARRAVQMLGYESDAALLRAAERLATELG